MNTYLDPTIFDSLNARQLTPSQIAQSFIPPEGFFDLIKRNNNLLIGPRGSGKTTLLKMLQLPALHEWKHEQALDVIKSIDYVSAFIPTDRAWEKQWALIDNLNVSINIQTQLKKSIFTIHTIRQIIDAFKFCISDTLAKNSDLEKFYVLLSTEEEVEIAKKLASALSLTIEIPSLDYVMFQLRKRLANIGSFINKNLYQANVLSIEEVEHFIFLDFMQAITLVIEVLNNALGKPEQKWALLFDELEIAPKDIRDEPVPTLVLDEP